MYLNYYSDILTSNDEIWEQLCHLSTAECRTESHLQRANGCHFHRTIHETVAVTDVQTAASGHLLSTYNRYWSANLYKTSS